MSKRSLYLLIIALLLLPVATVRAEGETHAASHGDMVEVGNKMVEESGKGIGLAGAGHNAAERANGENYPTVINRCRSDEAALLMRWQKWDPMDFNGMGAPMPVGRGQLVVWG